MLVNGIYLVSGPDTGILNSLVFSCYTVYFTNSGLLISYELLKRIILNRFTFIIDMHLK